MKGILFKPDMIQATVEGRKTNTRRPMNPQPEIVSDGVIICLHWKGVNCGSIRGNAQDWLATQAPYKVGETCYIKEAHYRYGHWIKNGHTKTGRQKWVFRAVPDEVRYLEDEPSEVFGNSVREIMGWFKRSPLFMPEWAARHFILIAAIRAERLQEITLEDAIAEGCRINSASLNKIIPHLPIQKFKELWDSINPVYPFNSDPWVRVYQFRLVC